MVRIAEGLPAESNDWWPHIRMMDRRFPSLSRPLLFGMLYRRTPPIAETVTSP